MLCDVVAGLSHILHAKKVAESSHIYKPNYDSQLLPLPKSSPPRDDMFIDDTSDVDVYEYVIVVILCQVYYILPVILRDHSFPRQIFPIPRLTAANFPHGSNWFSKSP